MAQTITFSSAVLHAFGRRKNEGAAIFHCALTPGVMKAMGWQELPETVTSCKLDGELAAFNMQLTPSDKLAAHAIELDISRVNSFEVVRLELEGQRDKGTRLQLRLKVEFGAGCGQLEDYMQTIGEGKGKLVVSYSKQEALALADGPQATAEQRAATSADQD